MRSFVLGAILVALLPWATTASAEDRAECVLGVCPELPTTGTRRTPDKPELEPAPEPVPEPKPTTEEKAVEVSVLFERPAEQEPDKYVPGAEIVGTQGRRKSSTSGEVPSISAGDAVWDALGDDCKYDEGGAAEPEWIYDAVLNDWVLAPEGLFGPAAPVELYCWICAEERIDDVVTGERSDGRGRGMYARYLDEIGGFVAADASALPDGGSLLDPGTIIVEGAVGSYGELFMPVFSYCTRDDTGEFELSEPDKSPRFALSAFLPDNFDVGGTRARLWGELYQRVILYSPRLGTTPPIEQGRLVVRLPTWFWVQDPVLSDEVEAVSDLDTIRVTLRAELVSVEWQWGSEKRWCGLDEMRAYEGHGVATLTPPCSKTFLKLGTPEIAATSRYLVQERVQYRSSSTAGWPDVAWVDHSPAVIDVRTSVGEIGIGEILALNVPVD